MKFENFTDAFFYPLTREVFFQDYWHKKPVLIPGGKEKLDYLFREHLAKEHLIQILKKSNNITGNPINASYYPPRQIKGFEKNYKTRLNVGSEQAIEFMESNYNTVLSFTDMRKVDESILRYFTRVKAALEVPGDYLDGIFYSPCSGAGLPLHVDRAETFQILFHGTKRWRLSKNCAENWDYPIDHLNIRDGTVFVTYPDTTKKYISPPDPAEIFEVDMNPGDILYIPEGFWHGTSSSEGGSLGLVVNISRSEFFDYVKDLVRMNFVDQVDWRKTTPPLFTSLNFKGKGGFEDFINTHFEQLKLFFEKLKINDPVLTKVQKKMLTKKEFFLIPELDELIKSRTLGEAQLADKYEYAIDSPLTTAALPDKDGKLLIYLFHLNDEVWFDDPRLFGFAKHLTKVNEFTAEEALTWSEDGKPYLWDEISPLLTALMNDGFLNRVD